MAAAQHLPFLNPQHNDYGPAQDLHQEEEEEEEEEEEGENEDFDESEQHKQGILWEQPHLGYPFYPKRGLIITPVKMFAPERRSVLSDPDMAESTKTLSSCEWLSQWRHEEDSQAKRSIWVVEEEREQNELDSQSVKVRYMDDYLHDMLLMSKRDRDQNFLEADVRLPSMGITALGSMSPVVIYGHSVVIRMHADEFVRSIVRPDTFEKGQYPLYFESVTRIILSWLYMAGMHCHIPCEFDLLHVYWAAHVLLTDTLSKVLEPLTGYIQQIEQDYHQRKNLLDGFALTSFQLEGYSPFFFQVSHLGYRPDNFVPEGLHVWKDCYGFVQIIPRQQKQFVFQPTQTSWSELLYCISGGRVSGEPCCEAWRSKMRYMILDKKERAALSCWRFLRLAKRRTDNAGDDAGLRKRQDQPYRLPCPIPTRYTRRNIANSWTGPMAKEAAIHRTRKKPNMQTLLFTIVFDQKHLASVEGILTKLGMTRYTKGCIAYRHSGELFVTVPGRPQKLLQIVKEFAKLPPLQDKFGEAKQSIATLTVQHPSRATFTAFYSSTVILAFCLVRDVIMVTEPLDHILFILDRFVVSAACNEDALNQVLLFPDRPRTVVEIIYRHASHLHYRGGMFSVGECKTLPCKECHHYRELDAVWEPLWGE